jgi:hypothetical protein
MIIYNVTIKVEWSIAEDWLKWMKETYIPLVLETGCFEKHQLVRLLQVDESDGPTYAAQYFALSLSKYDNYLHNHARGLSKLATDKWGERYLDFRTLMQVVE